MTRCLRQNGSAAYVGPERARDDGAALIITVMVLALVGILTTTILGVTVGNLNATRRTQDSARALDAADAGLTQAIAYLRTSGTRGIDCAPSCTTNRWGSAATPMSQLVAGSTDQRFEAWVAPLATSNPRDLRYRVTSTGYAGDGVRRIQADVTLTLDDLGLPLGIFARSVQGGGTPDLDGISIFTTGCVWSRSKFEFSSAPDAAYGIPAAVHSSKIITDSNGNGRLGCAADDRNNVHQGPGSPPATSPTRCRGVGDDYRWDHDSLGGTCADLAMAHPDYYGSVNLDSDAANEVEGTYIADDQALLDLFDLNPDPMPASKLEDLKAIAQSQVDPATGLDGYWTTASFTPPNPAVFSDAVLYFDLTASAPGSVVDLKDLNGLWDQDGCTDRSLLIVIEGANVRINGNEELAASIVLTSRTYGEVDQGNGTPDFVGTIFANTVNLSGTIDLELNSCFLSNLSPSLYSVVVDDYRELDRTDVTGPPPATTNPTPVVP